MNTCWVVGSWAANTWAVLSWDEAIEAFFEDLCTLVMGYLPDLRTHAAAHGLTLDSTTLFSKQIAAWRNLDSWTDTPTVIARDLS